jgi:hypothetical protein
VGHARVAYNPGLLQTKKVVSHTLVHSQSTTHSHRLSNTLTHRLSHTPTESRRSRPSHTLTRPRSRVSHALLNSHTRPHGVTQTLMIRTLSRTLSRRLSHRLLTGSSRRVLSESHRLLTDCHTTLSRALIDPHTLSHALTGDSSQTTPHRQLLTDDSPQTPTYSSQSLTRPHKLLKDSHTLSQTYRSSIQCTTHIRHKGCTLPQCAASRGVYIPNKVCRSTC